MRPGVSPFTPLLTRLGGGMPRGASVHHTEAGLSNPTATLLCCRQKRLVKCGAEKKEYGLSRGRRAGVYYCRKNTR